MKTHFLYHTTALLAPFLGLLLLASTRVHAGDVLLYAVQKGQLYVQSTPDAPVAAPGDSFIFEAFAEGTRDGEIYGVDLSRPGGGPSRISGDGYSFYRKEVFSSLSEMNSFYRSGDYRFDFDSENDFFTVAYVSLSGDAYPPAPHVANYTAAQAVNPAADFTVHWDAFSAATLDDTVDLYVYDETGSAVYSNTAMDGTTRSDTIPANTLAAGKTYRGEVSFWKSVDFTFDPDTGAFGLSFYYNSTQFSIVTTSSTGNNPPPTMSNPLLQQSSGQFLFHIDGVAGRSYRIESTVDFGSWDLVETITAPAGGGIDYTANVSISSSRFYRAVLLP